MPKYTYKGFEVIYKIELAKNLYKANGYVIFALNKKKPLPQKFHTEDPVKNVARDEIKKLLEDYIDFEWRKYFMSE